MWRCVIVVVLCLQLAGTEDLYWQPNTDWSTPSNWALGRAPCEGEVADLSDNPRGSVVVLGASTTIRSLVLPVGGKIVLGNSVTLRFSNKTSCTVESSGPLVAEVKEENKFVGAGPKYWECPQNWATQDDQPAKSAPCGSDRAFFREGHYYSTVQSNVSIAVQSLSVRGQPVTSDLSAITPEFNLDLKVVPECGKDPSLCPCPTNCKPVGPGKATGGSKKSGGNSGRTAAIVVVVLVVVALAVLGIVLALIYILRQRHKKTTPYMKDDLLGEPEDSMHRTKGARGEEVTFDNPIYESEIAGKETKDGGGGEGATSEEVKAREMEAIAILRPTGDEYEPVTATQAKDAPTKVSPPKEHSGGKKGPALNEYERL